MLKNTKEKNIVTAFRPVVTAEKENAVRGLATIVRFKQTDKDFLASRIGVGVCVCVGSKKTKKSQVEFRYLTKKKKSWKTDL